MARYRKKPVVIDAVQWNGGNVNEVLPFIQDGNPDFSHLPSDGMHVHPGVGHTPALGTLDIPTLEGVMTASPGDWIIRGIKGEFYPCKPDIFAATYESMSEPLPARDGETLSDEHFTDEHIRAIETACEKLWNGIPAENPIHGPRPHDHPLYVIASAAHLALNAACAEIAALRTKLADARVDAERLDWMESTRRGVEAVTGDDPFGEPTRLLWVCDEADAAAMLPTLREAIDAARAASGKDAR